MQLLAGNWEGTLTSDDGAQAHFSLSQTAFASVVTTISAADVTPLAITIQGGKRAAMRLLEGAKNVLVAIADAVPDPISGRPVQLLFDARVRGDRMVGQWLRRDCDGVIQAMGRIAAVRRS